jgi:hypothetical protein
LLYQTSTKLFLPKKELVADSKKKSPSIYNLGFLVYDVIIDGDL